ncbi:MAG: DMT family transporter [Gemmatimonadota bacterium]
MRTLPMLAAAAVGVQVGAAIVATRFVIGETTPAALALLRYAIGLACLAPFALAGTRPRFARRDLLPIALLGVGQFGVLIALLNYGLQFTSSARAALLFATMPLATMVLGAAFGHERLSARSFVGVVLTIAGIGFVLGEKVLTDASRHEWIGALAVLGSAGTGALCSVLYRPYLRRYPTVPVGAFAMFASVLALALPAGGEGFFARWPHFSAAGWGAVLFIGASSGIGYFLWLWALRHADPTRVTIFLSLSPLTAALLGAAVLGERVSGGLLLGLVCIVAGLWIAQRAPAQAALR